MNQVEIQKKINYVISGLRMKYKAEVTVNISGEYAPCVIIVAFSTVPYTCSIMIWGIDDEDMKKEELLEKAEREINFDLNYRIYKGWHRHD